MSAWEQLSGQATAAIVAAFGRPVLYQPEAGDAFTITGIPKKEGDEERHVDTIYGRLFVALADFPAPPVNGDEVTIDAAVYVVVDRQADAGGGCWLTLRLRA